MSASDLINTFGKTVTVTRYGTGAFVDGVYVPGATSTFDIVMSAQPLSGKELLNQPEGQRTRKFVKGYTDTELFTVEQASSKKADRVALNGSSYEVQNVEFWESTGNSIVPYWKVVLAEVNPS